MGGRLITLDSSALLALLDATDPHAAAVTRVLADDRGPYLVPAGVLGEIGYLIERRLGPDVLDLFVADLETGALSLDCGEGDPPRVRVLTRRYADLRLGFADAAVIACAERNGGQVLTLDRRDFEAVAGDGRIEVLPARR